MSHLIVAARNGKSINLNTLEKNAKRGLVRASTLKKLRDILMQKGDLSGSRRIAMMLRK